MDKSFKFLVTCFLFVVGTLGVELPGSAQASPPAAPKGATTQPQTEAERGERAFKTNCSRCHYAPDTLNPRITGTVLRHMRVRANLSASDERAILTYLNP
jgi:cytochrome c5